MFNAKQTENSRECCTSSSVDTQAKTQASLELLSLLSQGEESGEEQGWLTIDDLKRELAVC